MVVATDVETDVPFRSGGTGSSGIGQFLQTPVQHSLFHEAGEKGSDPGHM